MYWVRGSVSDRILDRPLGRSAYLYVKNKSVQKYERGGLLRPPLYEDFGVKGVILTEKLGNIRVKRKKTGCQIGVK